MDKNKLLFNLTIGEFQELNRRIFREILEESSIINDDRDESPGQKREIIGIEEVSEITGYARQTLYGFVSNRKIPFIKRPGAKFLRFRRSEIQQWMEQKEEGLYGTPAKATKVQKITNH